MQIGIVHVSSDWLIMKPVLIAASLAIMIAPVECLKPFFWFGVAALIYNGYNAIHEFIHAAAVWYYGGAIKGIYLRMLRPFIDFSMDDPKDSKEVFLTGAIADFVMGISVAVALVTGFAASANLGWVILALCWAGLFFTEETLHPNSDIRVYSRLSRN